MFPMKSKRLILSFARITIPMSTRCNSGIPYLNDLAKSNSLISRLSKHGRISDARQVFDEMPERDVITWMAAINGYVRCGLVEEARELFDRVDAVKDVATWTAMIAAYARSKKIEEAERLFLAMPTKNVVSWNTMMEGYARNGRVDSALDLFDKIPEKSVVSWNMIVAALARSGRVEEAQRLFDSMPERNVVSWTTMVAGLAKAGRVDEARRLFDRMPARNVVSWNAMVAGYARNARPDEAREMFERMPERNASSWNAMIGNEPDGASKLFDEMPRKDLVSWTAMIARYVRLGRNEEALKIFSRMAAEDTRPNEATFAAALKACGSLAGLNEGQQVHQMIIKTVYRDSEILTSALINMYSKCGQLGCAKRVFDDGSVSRRDLVSWNAMISGYAHHGLGSEAIELFDRLQKLGLRPNDVTYVGLLSACSHAGLVEEGLNYFDELVRDKSIQVKEKHYSCYVDLCGRAGKLEQALNFIERLQTKPSVTVWGALIAGCNVYDDLYIGNLAAQKVLEEGHIEKANAYSLMSSVYASSGDWKEVANVRLTMKEQGLKKQPGCSWIQVENTVHVFVVGDKSHGRSEMLFSLLFDLHQNMKIGFVSNCGITLDDDL